MAGLQIYKQGKFDETRTFPNGKAELAHVDDGMTAGRFTMQPGWKWSKDVKPIVGTQSCALEHFGYCLSGRMHIRMDDGEESEIGPGDFVRIRPGHDAWVVGDEPCELLDFSGATHYAVQGLGDLARRESGYEAPRGAELH